ncbi:hypothetical protein BGZ95_008543 [Linnemannia exigua]|uniref:Uncharacterized protein n=1 Tax=Linnemannia exigua TaxID=604196 RepID=A0AAD4H788_9FUNG|nr:hypothetical protein BGZ95_008543 [Linnemannia exigua]
MEPTRSSYVEYGQGNMLNLDAGTIKRKIDSNEYDDEIIQEVQPNGKRTCSPMNHSPFSNFGTPTQQTPKAAGPAWSQPNPSPLLRTAAHHATALSNKSFGSGLGMQQGYQTPESGLSSSTSSPFTGSSMNMDMDMESDNTVVQASSSPSMAQSANAMFKASLASPILSQDYHQQQLQQQHYQQQQQQQAAVTQNGTGLLPSALPVPGQGSNGVSNNNEYVPVHGRSMQIPSYARVPLNEANEARKYRDQRWSSCIYGVDTRIGQGMMI